MKQKVVLSAFALGLVAAYLCLFLHTFRKDFESPKVVEIERVCLYDPDYNHTLLPEMANDKE